MEVVAKTKGGCLIQASQSEIKEILNAVTGEKPEEVNIGQKIPAIDYASTIMKVKTLKKDYHFTQIFHSLDIFNEAAIELKLVVENASEIEV